MSQASTLWIGCISMLVACTDAPRRSVGSFSVEPGGTDPPVSATAMVDSDQAKMFRERLVAEIARRDAPWPGEPWNPRVLAAIGEVPRHAFVPDFPLAAAYRDAAQPIGLGQTISQPTVVAMMAQALELDRSSKVLEIGTGSGYAAAVVSRLSGHVYSIELHEPLATSARQKLSELGYDNITVRAGDGYKGWPEHAPFDRIVLTAAPPELPAALVDQLADGGVLVAPVGPEGYLQRLYRYRKKGQNLTSEDLGGVMFVPMVRGD